MLRAPLTVLGETDWVLSTDLELFDISRQPMHEWNWTPVMQPVRQHPDFYRFLERAGLIEYWDASAWPKFCERDDAGVITCQ